MRLEYINGTTKARLLIMSNGNEVLFFGSAPLCFSEGKQVYIDQLVCGTGSESLKSALRTYLSGGKCLELPSNVFKTNLKMLERN